MAYSKSKQDLQALKKSKEDIMDQLEILQSEIQELKKEK